MPDRRGKDNAANIGRPLGWNTHPQRKSEPSAFAQEMGTRLVAAVHTPVQLKQAVDDIRQSLWSNRTALRGVSRNPELVLRFVFLRKDSQFLLSGGPSRLDMAAMAQLLAGLARPRDLRVSLATEAGNRRKELLSGANPQIYRHTLHQQFVEGKFNQRDLWNPPRVERPKPSTPFLVIVGRRNVPAEAKVFPISIYLADETIHEQVEAAIEEWLATADLAVEQREEPVVGSWFRRMRAGIKESVNSGVAREAMLTAAHAADTRLILAQDAAVTATLLQNLGPVIGSLQPTKDAIVRVGSLLIVKIDWAVQIFQLTSAQQALLDHRPQLASSPAEIIAALQLAHPDGESLKPVAEPSAGRPALDRRSATND